MTVVTQSLDVRKQRVCVSVSTTPAHFPPNETKVDWLGYHSAIVRAFDWIDGLKERISLPARPH